MPYYIFFDESGKIDRQKSKYSYYGALGIKKSHYEYIKEILSDDSNKRELHFQKFNLTDIERYLSVLSEVLNKASFNVYLVDRDKALNIADRLSISTSKLRELLYIKIPERLIYGILRHLIDFYNIDIYIDKCDEYDKYDIKSKLEYQLNAQAIYRDKKYFVKNVTQIDSKDDIILQSTDVFLGIISFLVEGKYLSIKENLSENEFKYIINTVNESEKQALISSYRYNEVRKEYVLNVKNDEKKLSYVNQLFEKNNYYTQSSIQKSELIYRLLNSDDKIDKLTSICLYLWEQEGEELESKKVSEYISKFVIFKTNFDNFNKVKILNTYKSNNKEVSLADYESTLGFGRNSSNLVKRYLEELNIIYMNNNY